MKIAIAKELDEYIEMYDEESAMGRFMRDCKHMIENLNESLKEKDEMIEMLSKSEAYYIERAKEAEAKYNSVKKGRKAPRFKKKGLFT